MKKLLAAALLCSAAATPVLAQSNRYYGALDYGTLSMSGSGSYSSPNALTLSGGYRFLPNMAGEVGIAMIGDATANVSGGGQVNVSQSILSAVAVGTIPINPNINVFGKAGVGMHNGELNGLPDDLIFGFGGQFVLNPKLGFRLQYESLGRTKISNTSNRADLTRLSFGATYNF
jgi:hypothetical protein